MKKIPLRSRVFNPRAVAAFILVVGSVSLGVLSVAGTPQGNLKNLNTTQRTVSPKSPPSSPRKPGLASNSGPGWSVVSSPNTTEQQLLGVNCISTTDCWAVGYYYPPDIAYSQTLTEHWDGNSWTIVASPNVKSQGTNTSPNRLTGVACNSTNDCWAVGYSQTSLYSTLIEHWDGTSWTIVSSPSPSPVQNQLYGVVCNSVTDCWAVGAYKTGTNNHITQTLTLHWDGTLWSAVSSANTNTTAFNRLNAVTCSTSSDCWAVGYAVSGSNLQTLIERWNGSSWTIVSSSDTSATADNILTSITCTSGGGCWAGGYYDSGNLDNNGNDIYQTLLERWNGRTWSIVASPNTAATDTNFLIGLACTSVSQCWAVGYAYGATSETALIENWNGSSWSIVPAPTSATTQYNYLNAIACIPGAQCWAVGYHEFQYTLTENWSGNSWSIVPSPSAAGGGSNNSLNGVTCNSATDCWAVGHNSVGQSFIQHWNGNQWSIVFVPLGGRQFNYLDRVRCSGPNDCWAVGFSGTANFDQALIVHWNGSFWSEVAAPNNANSDNDLFDVTCTSTNNCWAAGSYFDYGTDTMLTLLGHWDGTSWSIVPSPNWPAGNPAPYNELEGISCTSASDCWSVGLWGDFSTSTQTLAEHWDGNSWTVVPSANTGQFSQLRAVTCSSSSDCWSVGVDDSGGQGIIEHWDGMAWSIVSWPMNPPFSSGLRDVTCPSSSNCWAVGIQNNFSPLALHWDGNAWTSVSPAIYNNVDNLNGVACPSPAQCWAVGDFRLVSQTGSPFVAQTLVEVYSLTTPPLTNVGSRMTHGSAGTFDLDLPLTGTPAIECRRGGANGNYSIVFNFANDVPNCGTAATAGGSVVAGPNTNQCTLNLTGVPNGQTINVELDNVTDSFDNTGNVSVPVGFLIGDTNKDGFVDAIDTSQTKSQSGSAVSQSNLREDVNVDGFIDAVDVSLVKSKSGSVLSSSSSTAKPTSSAPKSK